LYVSGEERSHQTGSHGTRSADVSDVTSAERSIPRGRAAGDVDRTPAEEPALWLEHVQFAHHRDAAVLARLVDAYRPYALGLARQLHRGRQSFEDLDQVALEALVRALQRFDPDRGIPFPAFATPVILGAVRRYYRDQGWSVRVPRRVHEVAAAEQDAVNRLTSRCGRAPTPTEVAADLGIGVDHLLEIRLALHARRVVSLEATTPSGSTVAEELGRIDQRLSLVDDQLALTAAVERLDAPTRSLVRRYFYDGQAQTEIARDLGVSQMQVSRLLATALGRLRAAMAVRPDRARLDGAFPPGPRPLSAD
jgi:RNA polymerase sigma-B factor